MKRCAILLACCLLAPGCARLPSRLDAPPAREAGDDAWLDPAAQQALYLGMVDGLIRQGRYEAAIAFLAKYQKTGPDTPRFRKLTGDALAGAGRYEEAIASYRGALQGGLAAAARDGIARAEAARGDWRAAEQDFRLAALLDPANAGYLNNLGYAQLHLGGEAVLAVDALRRAHELAPQSGRIRANLLLALSRGGRQEAYLALLGGVADARERRRLADFSARWSPEDPVSHPPQP